MLAIRESLLQFGRVNKNSVFVEVVTAPQPFQKRLVKTGLSDEFNVEIVDGLRKTDNINVLGSPVEEKKNKSFLKGVAMPAKAAHAGFLALPKRAGTTCN